MALKKGYKVAEMSEILKTLEHSSDGEKIILSRVMFRTSLIQLEGKIGTLGLQMPQDYNEFLNFTNGAYLYGVTIYGANAVTNYHKMRRSKLNSAKKYPNLWCIGSALDSNNIAMELNKKDFETNGTMNRIFKENENSLETIAKSFTEFLYRLVDNKSIRSYH